MTIADDPRDGAAAPVQGDVRSAANGDRWLALAALALVVLFVAVLLLGAAHSAADELPSAGDNAAIELHALDVGGPGTPLLGQPTRFGFNNPGPLQYWTLAIGYRLFGMDIGAGAAVVAIVGVLLIAWSARRAHAPGVLLWTIVVALILGRAMGVELRDPWNPWMPVLWFFAFAVICWRLGNGDRAMLPAAIGVGSFALQSHVQYGTLVAIVGAWGLGCGIAAERTWWRGADADGRRARRRSWRPILAAMGVVLVVSWGAPVVEQLTADKGNVSRFFDYLDTDLGPQTYQVDDIPHELGYGLRPLGPWSTGYRSSFLPHSWRDGAWSASIVGSVIVAGVVAWRRRQRELWVLAGIALAAIAGAVASFLTIRGPGYEYLVRFMWPVATVTWWAIGWCWWGVLRDRCPVKVGRGLAIIAVLVGSGCVVDLALGALESREPSRDQILIQALGPEMLAVAPDEEVLQVSGTNEAIFAGFGFITYLERHGHPVEAGEVFHLGEHRADRVATTRFFVVEGPDVDQYPRDPSQRYVASYRGDAADDEVRWLEQATEALEDCGRGDLVPALRNLDYGVLERDLAPDGLCIIARTRIFELQQLRDRVRVAEDWTRVDLYIQDLTVAQGAAP